MVGMTNYVSQGVLNHVVGKTALFALPTAYLGLFTAVGTDAGTGFTEVTGGSYARAVTSGATWGAAAGTSPSSNSNAAAINFPTATANWGTAVAFGIFDATSAGNLLWWDYLGNYNWLPFTCTLASPGVLSVPAHGYVNGDQVVVSAEFGGGLPTTAGSWAALLTVAGVTADTFTAGVNTTSTGSGNVRKVVTQSIPSGITTSFNVGQFNLQLA